MVLAASMYVLTIYAMNHYLLHFLKKMICRYQTFHNTPIPVAEHARSERKLYRRNTLLLFISVFLAGASPAIAQITTVAGVPFQTSGPLPLGVNVPVGMAIAPDGAVYVAESQNHRVLRIDANGTASVFAGGNGGGSAGDGGIALQASFFLPTGLGVDANGNVFVADQLNHVIRRIDAQTQIITKIAGVYGSWGLGGDGGAANAAFLQNPVAVAVDANNNVYIADYFNNRVRRVDAGGTMTTFVTAAGPHGLAIHNGFLYIVESLSHSITRISLAGGSKTTVAGTGAAGVGAENVLATSSAMNTPRYVTVDAQGNIYFTDTFNNRVRKVNTNGIVETIAGTGALASYGDSGNPLQAALASPFGIAVNCSGSHVYVTESSSNRVRVISTEAAESEIHSVIGSSFGDHLPATQTYLNGPRDVAVDPQGNLFVADTDNRRIRRVEQASGLLSTAVGTGAVGNPDGPALGSGMTRPLAVDFDNGTLHFVVGPEPSFQLGGIRRVENDVISFVANINNATGLFVGGGVGYVAVGPWSVSNFLQGNWYSVQEPFDVATNAAATAGGAVFYYSSPSTNRIMRYSNGTNTAIAGTGVTGFSGDGGLAVNARLNSPRGIAMDAAGNIFFADQGNRRVRVITSDGYIYTVAGNGSSGFSGDGGDPLLAAIQSPYGIDLDEQGNLYIADNETHIIRRVALPNLLCATGSAVDVGQHVVPACNTTSYTYFFEMPADGKVLIQGPPERVVQVYSVANPNMTLLTEGSGVVEATAEAGTNILIRWITTGQEIPWQLSVSDPGVADVCNTALPVTEGTYIIPLNTQQQWYLLTNEGNAAKNLTLTSSASRTVEVYSGNCDSRQLLMSGDASTPLQVVVPAGQEAFIKWIGSDFTWTITFEDAAPETCESAMNIVEGINMLPTQTSSWLKIPNVESVSTFTIEHDYNGDVTFELYSAYQGNCGQLYLEESWVQQPGTISEQFYIYQSHTYYLVVLKGGTESATLNLEIKETWGCEQAEMLASDLNLSVSSSCCNNRRYRYVVPVDGNITISTNGMQNVETYFDVYLNCNTLDWVAYDWDYEASLQVQIEGLKAGQELFIEWYAYDYNDWARTSFPFEMSIAMEPLPFESSCLNPIPVGSGQHFSGADQRWFSFTIPGNGEFEIFATSDNSDLLDPQLQILTSCLDGDVLPVQENYEGNNSYIRLVGRQPGSTILIHWSELISDGSFSWRINAINSSQSFTFDPIPELAYGETLELPGTATSGLAITYELDDPAIASVNGNSITATAVGYTVLKASQAGLDGSFLPISPQFRLLKVNPRPLTIIASVADKEYDGTLNASLSAIVENAIEGDEIGAIGSAVFQDKNVGVDKAIILSTFSLTGVDANNYTLSAQPASTTANINPKPVTITGVISANKEYDGTVLAQVSGGSLQGVINGDNLSFTSGAASFQNRNVGNNKTVSFTGFTLTGADANNYTLSAQPASTTAHITPKPVTLTGVTSANKEYDGTVSAHVSGGALQGLVIGDNVSFNVGAASFADENVGNNKLVTYTGFSLAGADASNYVLSAQPASSTAGITPKPVTITGVTSMSKEYDGTLSASVSGGALQGVIDGDDLAFSPGAALFADKNVGNNKNVTYTGFNLTGADANNYILSAQPVSSSADITPKAVSIAGVTSPNKEYDATNVASFSGGSIQGAINGDAVNFSIGTASFENKNVGTNKTVSYTGFGLTGADAANYVLSAQPVSTTANITPKPVTITGVTSANKEYDGTVSALALGGVLQGVISGDVVAFTPGTGSFENKNASNGKPVTFSGFVLTGADALNYSLSQPAGVTANILRKVITITGVTSADKVYDGTTTAVPTGGTLSGAIAGDNVTLVPGTGTFNSRTVGSNKNVTFSNFSIAGNDAFNYLIAAQPSAVTASITPKAVSIGAVVIAGKTYDGTTNATIQSAILNDAISGDDVRLSAVANFQNANVGVAKPVVLSALSLTGVDASNYTLSASTTAPITASIAPREILVRPATNQSKVFGESDPVFTFTADPGLLGGDVFTGTLSRQSGENAGLYDILLGSLSAGGNYTLSLEATKFEIRRVQQTITVNSISARTLGEGPFTVTASATSGLPVTLESATPDIISVNGNMVTLLKAGNAILRARQLGNLNINPAAPIEVNFCVNPGRPTITANFDNPEAPVLTTSSTTGVQWFLNGLAVNGAVQKNLVVSQQGEYTVTEAAGSCVSQPSLPISIVITALENVLSALSVYPNPAKDFVRIDNLPPHAVIGLVDGRGVSHGAKVVMEDNNAIVDLRDMPSGVFVIRITTTNESRIIKIMKL